MVDYMSGTETAAFLFRLSPVRCTIDDAIVNTVTEGIVGLRPEASAGPFGFVDQVFEPRDRHLRATFLVNLKPGCYRLIAVPSDDGATFRPANGCSVAAAETLRVFPGRFTEQLLVSQCTNDPLTSGTFANSLSALNRAPRIDDVTTSEMTPGVIRACVTHHDPNDDPVELEWVVRGATDRQVTLTNEPRTVIGFENDYRIWSQCALARRSGSPYEVEVTTHDVSSEHRKVRREELTSDERSKATTHIAVPRAPRMESELQDGCMNEKRAQGPGRLPDRLRD